MKNRKKSFTLVEMVVVMIVIGILAVAIIPRLQGVQTKARDTQRKTDLAAIRTALEVYAMDSGGNYPYSSTLFTQFASYPFNNTGWNTLLPGVISIIPVDPINNGTYVIGTGIYTYQYTASSSIHGLRSYSLQTQLENHMDPDRCQVKRYKTLRASGTGEYIERCDPNNLTASENYLYDASIKVKTN